AVIIESSGEGSSRALLAGKPVWVAWVEEEGGGISKDGEASFDVSALSFPLEVRARAPGDRLRGNGGSRKVKKILLEHRILSVDRNALPVLVDASGEVLWIPGVARSTVAMPSAGAPSIRIRIEP
ncbi:MAG: tRNA lysidine(34) synthetase TilS, partial [Longimicrobiales bacterium]|nr:tRNA lysidine(34) synthetase TilS [Longimicrobiales bacterium]